MRGQYKMVKKYKGFTIMIDRHTKEYAVFTREEMEQPVEFRSVEMECGSVEIAMEFIDSY